MYNDVMCFFFLFESTSAHGKCVVKMCFFKSGDLPPLKWRASRLVVIPPKNPFQISSCYGRPVRVHASLPWFSGLHPKQISLPIYKGFLSHVILIPSYIPSLYPIYSTWVPKKRLQFSRVKKVTNSYTQSGLVYAQTLLLLEIAKNSEK